VSIPSTHPTLEMVVAEVAPNSITINHQYTDGNNKEVFQTRIDNSRVVLTYIPDEGILLVNRCLEIFDITNPHSLEQFIEVVNGFLIDDEFTHTQDSQ